MKNKVTLTITADEYRLRVSINGQNFGRHMKKERRGIFHEQHIDCPDYEETEDIHELLPDVLDDVMMNAFDVADMLDFLKEVND